MENEEKTELFFNSPNENPYSSLTLNSKIAQRSRIINDLVDGRVDVLDALGELQNLDDSIINELIQNHKLASHWQAEAQKWREQAELIQARFQQFQKTRF